MKTLIATTLALALQTASVSAMETGPGPIQIHGAYVTETLPTAMAGAGYMRLTNTGDADDYLIGVKAEYPRVMIHTTQDKDDVALMVHVDRLTIPAGGEVVFEPGGLHVMFMGLNGNPFKLGETIDATLVFENAGNIDIEFKVEPRSHSAQNHKGN